LKFPLTLHDCFQNVLIFIEGEFIIQLSKVVINKKYLYDGCESGMKVFSIYNLLLKQEGFVHV
jgi:hypothetical protein